jgi:hypothetical protein
VSQDASSLGDRIQFGLIAAAFGSIIGLLAALAVLGLFAAAGVWHGFNGWMLGFSAAFFFVVGLVRGSDASETVVDSFVAALAAPLVALGIAEGGGAGMPGEFGWRSSLWWAVTYFAGMVLLAWFA